MSATAPWLFRVASSPRHGGGHVARCRALAAELVQFSPVTFALDRDGMQWRDALAREGFGVLSEDDALDGPWAGSLLDGYDFTEGDAGRLKRLAAPLAVIDDFLKPPAAADLVICPGGDPDAGTTLPMQVLAGPQFALLSAAFRDVPARTIQAVVRNILVTFGRRDATNATGLALDALHLLPAGAPSPRVTVVMGREAPHLAAVRRRVERMELPVDLLVDVDDMPARLQSTDLAIGAGGVSLYERLACGVPSVTVLTAENQAAGAKHAAEAGATLLAGRSTELSPRKLAALFAGTMADPDLRRTMAFAARQLVDGKGAARVAGCVETLRPTPGKDVSKLRRQDRVLPLAGEQ